MGLLDDLKKQAEAVKAQQAASGITAETLRLVDERMKLAFTYLNDLLNQLRILKPQNPLTYVLPGIGELKNLDFGESFVDYRKKKINDKEHFDTLRLFIRWQGTHPLVVVRDMPGTIEQVRTALWQCRARFEEEESRTKYGTVDSVRFKIEETILCEIAVKADYEHRRLLIKANNLLRTGPDHFEVPADEVSETVLEELAHMLLGKNSGFRRYRSTGAAG